MRGSAPKSLRVPQVAVLSHHQPVWAKTSTFISKEVARELVQRMAAEKVSASVIRMMAPDTVFLDAVKAVLPEIRYIPTKLPPAEVANCKFIRPSTDKRPTLASFLAGWDWTTESDYLPRNQVSA
jgi:hypothetical protein